GYRVDLGVRAAAVDVLDVVVGPDAPAGRVALAYRRHAVVHGDAVRSGIGPEVTVERTVPHHDNNRGLPLVAPGRNPVRAGRAAGGLGRPGHLRPGRRGGLG